MSLWHGESLVLASKSPARQALLAAAKIPFEAEAVKAGGLLRLVLVHGLALHEQALHFVQGLEPAVARLECAHLILDAEQPCDVRLQKRREIEKQLRFRLGGKRGRGHARGEKAVVQHGIFRLQRGEEFPVELEQALAAVELVECESPGAERIGAGGQRRDPAWAEKRKIISISP